MRKALAAAVVFTSATMAPAAEIVRLTAENFEELTPVGKEVDAIIGDYVLRSDRLVVVIADTVEGRKANMSIKNVAGSIIDFTTRDSGSDQLSCCYPAPGLFFTRARVVAASGPKVTLVCEAEATAATPRASVRYTLMDGQDALLVETTITNPAEKPMMLEPADDLRAIKTFVDGKDQDSGGAWVVDEWWGQAYGFLGEGAGATAVVARSGSAYKVRYPKNGQPKVTIEPGKSYTYGRRMFAAADTLKLRGNIYDALGVKLNTVKFTVKDLDGFVPDASVVLEQGGKAYGSARTDMHGVAECELPGGTYDVEVVAQGRPPVKLRIDAAKSAAHTVEMEQAGYVLAQVTDANRRPIPCKVQFIGVKPTADPFFFPETGAGAVGNLYYAHHGRFKQALTPGVYDAVISYGPEYDIVEKRITIEKGKETRLTATLVRSVETAGWVSGEFHSHSSPSGDNVSSQLGRVLNLLCEHIEYAPCTEHQRIDSYTPHLRRLGVEHLMGTVSGMELTNQLRFNHQNAFPLKMTPRTQDNGAPQIDDDPLVQIQRLAGWDNNSNKLVQQNHPNIVQLAFDKDADGRGDGGFNPQLKHMDVIEVHPLAPILDEKPAMTRGYASGSNRVLSWVQMINLGRYVPAVINTDAHYNVHGSGFYRNYIKSPTDDPAKIAVEDIIDACEKGAIVMTTAPFMQVSLTSGGKTAEPGQSASYSSGAALRVKVQCANWYDINRVQVLINGRQEPSLNFTRQSHPQMFTNKTVRFEQQIPLKLDRDAHVIVVAIGEGTTLEKVYASGNGAKQPPVAVSNPIFVDVDGGGFKANGDELGAPLPR